MSNQDVQPNIVNDKLVIDINPAFFRTVIFILLGFDLTVDLQKWADEYNTQPNQQILKLIETLSLSHSTPTSIHDLVQLHPTLKENEWNLLRSLGKSSITKIDLLIEAIQQGIPIDDISKHLNWQEFEHLIAGIFASGGWKSTINFRFALEALKPSERSRYEIDVIAWKKPFVLVIDCKRYTSPSASPIKNAVEKQKERMYELFDRIPVIHDIPELEWVKWQKAIMIPMIITWRNHQLKFFDEVAICSAGTLLDLLAKFREYYNEDEWFSLIWKI